MILDFTIDRPAPLNPAEFRRAIVRGVTKVMLSALRRAKLKAPNQTGRYVTSMTTRVTETGEGVQGVMGSSAREALFVEEGSKPHLIVPRERKALSWLNRRVTGVRMVQTQRGVVRAGGRLRTTDRVFTKVVHHPGTPAQHVLGGALQSILPDVPRVLTAEVQAALGQGQQGGGA
jgi:hypothetical protein